LLESHSSAPTGRFHPRGVTAGISLGSRAGNHPDPSPTPIDRHRSILDEVLLKINGKRHWLWRAVDQNGVVLDILVQARRDQHAAERFLRRVIDGVGYQPRVVITDKLASYPPALRRACPTSITVATKA
jgi:transposase-like protein